MDNETLGDMIEAYLSCGAEIKQLQDAQNILQQEQEGLKYRIDERMSELDTSSITDQITKHRATKYTEQRWVVMDPTELKAAIIESPYLMDIFLSMGIDHRLASKIAKDAPDLVAEIPGIGRVEQTKLRITRGKG